MSETGSPYPEGACLSYSYLSPAQGQGLSRLISLLALRCVTSAMQIDNRSGLDTSEFRSGTNAACDL